MAQPRIPLAGAPLAVTAVLAVLTVLVTGCGPSHSASGGPAAGSSPSAGPASPATSTSATGSGRPGSGGSGSGASGSGASGSGSGSGGSGSGGSGSGSGSACATAGLTVTLSGSQGAAGSVYSVLDFTNKGGSPCTLYGFPGVSLDNSGGQIGAAATRANAHSPALVTLAPGGKANAIVRVTEAGNYPASDCSPDAATFLKVYPPNQTQAIDVPYKSTGCRKSSAKLLSIEAITAGAGNANG